MDTQKNIRGAESAAAKKILIVCHYYLPHIGGLEVVVDKNARELARRGNRVHIVTCAHDKEKAGVKTENGVRTFRERALNIFDVYFGIPTPFGGAGLMKRVWSEVKAADVVHAHDVFYQTSWLAALFAWWHQRPLLLTQHAGMVEHSSNVVMLVQRAIYATIGRMIFALAKEIIVYNKTVEEFLLERGVPRGKIRELRNGIDIDAFSPATPEEKKLARRSFNLPEDRKLVLFVGRMVPKKGFDVLLGARDPSYDLVFAGSGVFPKKWRDAPRVHFLGPIARERLPALYRASDLCAIPTKGELFTLTMQEALASGLPVVTTDEPDYDTYDVDRENIAFCSRRSIPFAKRIKRLLSDESVRARMAAYSRELALAWFDEEANLGALVDCYRRLADAKKETIVTTSWDDGHVLDIKLASLLSKYELPATFYISPADREIPIELRLSEEQVRTLAERFEIGAHTETHPYLPAISEKEAWHEIESSKATLEKWIQKDVRAFAYPKGGYTGSHKSTLKETGFLYGRTVRRFSLQRGDDPYEAPTSVHTYDHWSDIWPVLRLARFHPVSFFRLYRRWDRQAIALFERAHEKGGVFHLWGHSWEVDERNDWERLERVFAHISGKPQVKYLPNGALV